MEIGIIFINKKGLADFNFQIFRAFNIKRAFLLKPFVRLYYI